MQRYVSEPLPVPRHAEAPYNQAEVRFEDLEHGGPSFFAHIYINNPDAEESTGRDASRGYAGDLVVFGHGECWGDPGHCDVPEAPASPYDLRPPHPLTPVTITVDVTDALKSVDADEVTVTVLAFESDPERPDRDRILRFRRLTLVTYD